MSNQYILDYVDYVISKSEIPNEYKAQLENELIRNIIAASEKTNIEEAQHYLYSPEKLAEELSKIIAKKNFEDSTKKIMTSNSESLIDTPQQCHGEPAHRPNRHPRQRYSGEYMREQSNVNLKLLYIPLVQISSGTERISMPLMDDDDD